MLAHWFIYVVAATSLFAAAGVAIEQIFAVWRRPRRGVWLVALTASLVLPVLVAARGLMPGVRPSQSARLPNAVRIVDDKSPDVTAATTVLPRLVDARAVIGRRADPLFDDSRLVWLWCLGSAALLALFVTAAARLRYESHRWRSGRLDGVDILVAPSVGPAVVGFVRPHIVLPEWTLSLDVASRELILRHELEHIRARDPYLLLVAAMSIIVLPWNLALWFVARRLTLAVELDCDQRVLDAGGSVREYGSMLLEVVSRRNARGLLLGASLIQPRRFLARRIRSMVTNRPRRPRLISLVLATAVAVLTVGATRLPTPEPLRFGRRARPLAYTQGPIRRSAMAESGRPRVVWPRVRSPKRAGPKPRISADWENAPIELVVAAFAQFSGKRISIGPDVKGSVTARIIDEPWDEALAHIMGVNGYRLVVHSDSSITISIDRRGPAQSSPSDGELQNRAVSGRVIDASTNLPMRGVTVDVIGLQAIGEPNRTCTTARGTFQLNVPDGEVWLDASVPGYEFSRVTLAATENRAVFLGRKSPSARGIANVRNLEFRPAFAAALGSKPLIIIDGAVAGSDTLDVRPCGRR